ncbi:MAG: ABC transporter ATP-binding protein [Planctomycetota bacterium]
MDMVVADNLVKTFPTPDGPEKVAVCGLSFSVTKGQIYGLLGFNGAGKTTTLRMLSGLMTPTSGHAYMAGFEVSSQSEHVKRILGFLTANTGLYQRLNARELLIYFAQLHGMGSQAAAARADHLISWLGIHDFSAIRCGALSTGQKQRVNIARALISEPQILIMDEPTLGLDVLSQRIILEYIRRECDEGKTIIISTHYLNEAETLCDKIGLLHEGKLVAEGNLAALQELSGRDRLDDIFVKLIDADQLVEGLIR